MSFQLYEISCIMIGFTGFSWKNRRADNLILVDSWWLSLLWKQSFSKTKNKKLFNFASLFFLFFFLVPDILNYRSNMTLWVSREVVKRDWCPKIHFFKECVMTLLTSTPIFHKKSKLIWFLSCLTFFLLTQKLFWISAGLKDFLWMNKRPYLNISFCNLCFSWLWI